ncbi:winged helix-turn-helix transcriptional regulator [Sneathiella sp. P13V-1]|uniref:response regulator transcription factor n=1 Tax=Sneathiella sp. P13V-1 TaxID=2697366 RepID=UPI00187BC2AF|nr:response regulator transcription factor [Sneathiella sp. P13V-1]MBE7637730.1 winged helix-turn-helix transcriptional regulator [Sneathiella sp. P13V-1]
MRVMIIDRFEICRSGFKFVIEEAFKDSVVCEANTVSEAINCMENHGLNLVIFSQSSGVTADIHSLEKLKYFALSIPVVIIGDALHWSGADELTKYNISGFLDRSTNKDVMIAALQLVLAGGLYFPPELHAATSGHTNNQAFLGNSPNKNAEKRLTPRQIEVLTAVAEGKSNKVIAAELGISPGTVKVHVSNLMKDLQANNRTQAVTIANNLNILSQYY